MELSINNVKSTKKFDIKLDNKIYLISGNSGIGKSTILESIRFCLFGGVKKINPIGEKSKLSVNIKYKDILITRFKNPEFLELVKNKIIYKNEEAQHIINQYFYEEEIWMLSSYIPQKKRNIFLDSNNQEKLEILKKLIFKEDRNTNQKYFETLDKLYKKIYDEVKKLDGTMEYLTKDVDKNKEENKDYLELYNNNKDNKIVKDLDKIKIYLEFKEHNINKEDLDKYPKNLNNEMINNWKEFIKIKNILKKLNLKEIEKLDLNLLKKEKKNSVSIYTKINELNININYINNEITKLKEENSEYLELYNKNNNNNNKFIKDLDKIKLYLEFKEYGINIGDLDKYPKNLNSEIIDIWEKNKDMKLLNLEDLIKEREKYPLFKKLNITIEIINNEIIKLKEINKPYLELYYKEKDNKEVKNLENFKQNNYKYKLINNYPENLNLEMINRWKLFKNNKIDILKNINNNNKDLNNLILEKSDAINNLKIIDKYGIKDYKQLIYDIEKNIKVKKLLKLTDYLKVLKDKYILLNEEWKNLLNDNDIEYFDCNDNNNKIFKDKKQTYKCPECNINLFLENNKLQKNKFNINEEIKKYALELIDNINTLLKYKNEAEIKADILKKEITPPYILLDLNYNNEDLEIFKTYKNEVRNDLDKIEEDIKNYKLNKLINDNNLNEFINFPFNIPDDFEEYYQNYLTLKKNIINNNINNNNNNNNNNIEYISDEKINQLEKIKLAIDKCKNIDINLEKLEKLEIERDNLNIINIREDIDNDIKIINIYNKYNLQNYKIPDDFNKYYKEYLKTKEILEKYKDIEVFDITKDEYLELEKIKIANDKCKNIDINLSKLKILIEEKEKIDTKNIRENLEEIDNDIINAELFLKYNKLSLLNLEDYIVPNDFDEYYKKYLKTKEVLEKYKDIEIFDINKNEYLELEKIKIAIDKCKNIDTNLNKLKEVIEKRNKFTDQLLNIEKLIKIIRETENMYMENKIGEINRYLNQILEKIIDDLEINITMFRENYKPVVNLNIIFEGKNYPDINYMSGGQIDRISIALTLTFNIILNTPIIMLDETIDSLEEEKKKACLDSIKENIKNKIILITCPDSIEGFFDEIINL
jgi:DNA repair exonuclease SbcCD ATPase subunit